MLEKWDTTFRSKIISEAKHLTQSIDLCRLLKAAEKQTDNDDDSKLMNMFDFYSLLQVLVNGVFLHDTNGLFSPSYFPTDRVGQ